MRSYVLKKENKIMEDKKLKLLSLLNNNNFYKNEKKFKMFISLLNDVEFLLPFNNKHIVVLISEEDKIYIPLFTDEKQINNIKYTQLDKVKLDVVIKDIYKTSNYHAISINPYTNNYVMSKKLIDIFRVFNKI